MANCLGTKYRSRIQLRLSLGTSNNKVGIQRLKKGMPPPPQTALLLSMGCLVLKIIPIHVNGA